MEGELEEVMGLRFVTFSVFSFLTTTAGSGTRSPLLDSRSCFELFFFPFSDFRFFPSLEEGDGEGSKISDFLDFLGTEVLLGGNMFFVGIFPLFFSLFELLLELDLLDLEEDEEDLETGTGSVTEDPLSTTGNLEDFEDFSLFDDTFSVLLLLLVPLSPNIFSDFPPPPLAGFSVLISFDGPVGVLLPAEDDVLVISEAPLRLIGVPNKVSKEFLGLDFEPGFVLECFEDFPPPLEFEETWEEELGTEDETW